MAHMGLTVNNKSKGPALQTYKPHSKTGREGGIATLGIRVTEPPADKEIPHEGEGSGGATKSIRNLRAN